MKKMNQVVKIATETNWTGQKGKRKQHHQKLKETERTLNHNGEVNGKGEEGVHIVSIIGLHSFVLEYAGSPGLYVRKSATAESGTVPQTPGQATLEATPTLTVCLSGFR